MKKVILLFKLILLVSGVGAQIKTPKIMGILMIGKSAKPILDIYIVDSTCKNEFKFDVHDIDLYGDKKTMQKLFTVFQNEEIIDSTKHYDYSFGTFLFSFLYENGKKVKIIANRKQSLLLFKNIITLLSPDDLDETLIIPMIKNNIAQINF